MMNNLQPGSFGLTTSAGNIGRFIKLGQIILRDNSRFGHAFFVLDNNEILQAVKGGAKIRSLYYYLNRAYDDPYSVAFFDPVSYLNLSPEDEIKKRQQLVSIARDLVGTPYNYLDYLALALSHFNIKTKWVKQRLARNDVQICSQEIDFIYQEGGMNLFNDHRLPGEVTPGSLDQYRISTILKPLRSSAGGDKE